MNDKLPMIEEFMLSTIKEYLNKNRCFVIEDIIPYINLSLKKFSINLNYEGIRVIIKSLIKKNQIIEGSKFVREEVLKNENRHRIYEYICNNPGIYFNHIVRKLKLSNYLLAWHIQMLIKFKFIRRKQIARHEVFFKEDLMPNNDNLLAYLSREKSQELINYLLKNNNGCSKTHISKELKMHSTTVSNYISKLEEHGILLKKKLSRKTLFFVNIRYYNEILNC